MDEVEKSVIRLAHWLDHNIEHIKGYKEVADRLESAGMTSAAQKVREAIKLTQDANYQFSEALDVLRKEVPEDLLPQGSTHTHQHEHKHTHEHKHPHTHEFPYDHGRSHDDIGMHDHPHEEEDPHDASHRGK